MKLLVMIVFVCLLYAIGKGCYNFFIRMNIWNTYAGAIAVFLTLAFPYIAVCLAIASLFLKEQKFPTYVEHKR